jgi:UDP-N-acetylglucosamine--N-acetylmuramyl-(pentapeptide) pyrophosphoryl-undecaprenol N-acetylglucosamine transferase
MNYKFVIACGGTGGHLSPGIALAQKLTGSGHDCQLFISQKQVDARLIKKYQDLEYVPVPGIGFSLHPVRLTIFVLSLVRSIFFAFNWLRKCRPDVVVAFGGYISVGIVFSAYLLHIPIVLHEANRKPGRSVRLMRKLATRIYLPDGIRLRGINPSRIRYYGYPVREEMFRCEMEESRQALGFNITGKLLVIMGGSQGASIFNKWVVDNFEDLSAEGINIFCISGPIYGTDGVMDGISLNGTRVQAIFKSFSDQIPAVLSSADLVISRAGAGSIAEIIRCRTPSILIPYPFAADNHQLSNALFFERQGGGVLIHQEKMDRLLAEVKDLISNKWLLSRFQNNLQKMDRINCAELIKCDLLKLCGVETESVLAAKGEPA